MIVAGIDPGVTGALAVLDDDGNCGTLDMPVIEIAGREMVDTVAVGEWLHDNDVGYILIEHAQAMPKNGVVGMFNYGQAFGQVLSATQMYVAQRGRNRAPIMYYTLVKPLLWKKQMGLIGSGKSASLKMARELFPRSVAQFSKAKDHNRAEAALLAWWWKNHPLRVEDDLQEQAA